MNHQFVIELKKGWVAINLIITSVAIFNVPKNVHHQRCLKSKFAQKFRKQTQKHLMGKSQPIYLPSLVNNFFDHMWTSLGSTGREPLQTCPSLTKLLPISQVSRITHISPVSGRRHLKKNVCRIFAHQSHISKSANHE